MKDLILNNVLRQGTIAFPDDLLWHYKRIGLTEEEFMVLLLLMAYGQKKSNYYPKLSRLAKVMEEPVSRVQEVIASLMEKECLSIEKEFSLEDGHFSPIFSFEPLFSRLGALVADDHANQRKNHQEKIKADLEKKASSQDIFSIFEDEFGRPLTKMEISYLTEWVAGDGFSEGLIMEALRSAVSREKLNFKYIDVILRSWRQKGIITAKEARKEDQAGRKKKRSSRIKKSQVDREEKTSYDDLVINLME